MTKPYKPWPKPLKPGDEQEIASAIRENSGLVYVRFENDKEVRLSFVQQWETHFPEKRNDEQIATV